MFLQKGWRWNFTSGNCRCRTSIGARQMVAVNFEVTVKQVPYLLSGVLLYHWPEKLSRRTRGKQTKRRIRIWTNGCLISGPLVAKYQMLFIEGEKCVLSSVPINIVSPMQKQCVFFSDLPTVRLAVISWHSPEAIVVMWYLLAFRSLPVRCQKHT